MADFVDGRLPSARFEAIKVYLADQPSLAEQVEREIELRDAPYTSWRDDVTELWVSDGRGTERVEVPATDAYRVMVEEVSSVLRGGPGWVLPLTESRQTAAVLDAARASAASSRA